MDASWLEWAKVLATLGAAVVAAGVAGYFARHQYRIARAKLSLDLFERRIVVFQAAWEVCALYDGHGEDADARDGTRNALLDLLPQAQFLFGREMRDYLYGLVRVTYFLDFRQREMSKTDPASSAAVQVDAGYVAPTPDRQTLERQLVLRFAPFLDFEHWT